ncbi:MAG: PP-loop family protein, partial [Desulfovibrio sp.]|nr:PP-loop family protein [Desulfovibrio sp.]
MESKQDLYGKSPGTETEPSGGLAAKIPVALRDILAGMPRIIVAFSGGLDSRFLCHAAALTGGNVLAIHARGPHISPRDSAYAEAWAKKSGAAYKAIRLDPLDLPEVAVNGRSRCYQCKKKLMASLAEAARGWNGILCDGGNADDLKEYRPGGLR